MRFIWDNRSLLKTMTKREVLTRYQGTLLGGLWSVLTPLLMLFVYTFVFSSVLRTRWPGSSDDELEFAIILFCGLIVFNLFAEVITRSPTLIVSNVNYVKKVIFPVEIIPLTVVGGALFNMLVSLVILLLFCLLHNGSIPWTIVLIPVVVFPFILLVLGFSWFLAALGVFARDIGQAIGVIVTAMMFLSPLFFPITALPERVQLYIYVNPLTFVIEQFRAVTIWGELPDWSGILLYSLISFFLAWFGYLFFKLTRKGFADVL